MSKTFADFLDSNGRVIAEVVDIRVANWPYDDDQPQLKTKRDFAAKIKELSARARELDCEEEGPYYAVFDDGGKAVTLYFAYEPEEMR